MVKETERAANGEALPDLSSPIWDPLWDACSALGMSVNFHIGGNERRADVSRWLRRCVDTQSSSGKAWVG